MLARSLLIPLVRIWKTRRLERVKPQEGLSMGRQSDMIGHKALS